MSETVKARPSPLDRRLKEIRRFQYAVNSSPLKGPIMERVEKFGLSVRQSRKLAILEKSFLDKFSPVSRDYYKKRIESLKQNRNLTEVSQIDPLTGLYNRGYILGSNDEKHPRRGILESDIERILYDTVNYPEKPKSGLSIAMLDIDHFKQFNDQFGHSAGDIVLRLIAQTIKQHLRGVDIAGRYGGEEFLLILPSDLNIAKKIIERMREAIGEIELTGSMTGAKLTASFGLTNLTEIGSGDSSKVITAALIDRADRALYESKENGRNQTTVIISEKKLETKG